MSQYVSFFDNTKKKDMDLLSKEQTISSYEIAEITGRNHGDVLRSIRNMEPAWRDVHGRGFALMLKIRELPNGGSRREPYYELTKIECLYISTKFNDEARAKLVLRWQELEIQKQTPQNYLEALKALVASEEAKLKLQEENQKQAQEIENKNEIIKHKSNVIEGLTDEIPTAELRQRIVQIVSNASPRDIPNRYNLLYEEFEKKYHVNLKKRIWNAEERGVVYKNRLDYIDKVFKDKGIKDLYDIACVLFETSAERFLKKRWNVKSVKF